VRVRVFVDMVGVNGYGLEVVNMQEKDGKYDLQIWVV